ncbi:MAG: O-antigen polysaccharide polymerase Wzy, partial [Romboutsia sp.]|nr:O-antigen polysaccharide polymerase Wzy [Romboutsia sp.]
SPITLRFPLTREAPRFWMLVVGVLSIFSGVMGLIFLTGSLNSAISLGGLRDSAAAILNEGSYKYVIWMNAVPIGSCLLWYYVTQRYVQNKTFALLISFALYIPLVPFYLYSSGRAKTVIPFLLLLILFDRYYHKISLKTAALIALITIPAFAYWAVYRKGLGFESFNPEVNIGYVFTGDLSRFDIAVCAISNFNKGNFDFFLGETYVAGILSTMLINHKLTGGTLAMAKVLNQDYLYNKGSPYATSLVIESYLNFGTIGVIIMSMFLGLFIKFADKLFTSPNIIILLLSISLFIYSPLNTSFRLSLTRIFWSAIIPINVILLLKVISISALNIKTSNWIKSN